MSKYRTHLIRLAVMALCASILCINMITLPAYASDATIDTYDRIDKYLSDIIPKSHFPSFSITIVDKEKVLLSESYGEGENTDTPYLLGSVSKSFTALCIMQLVERGKVDLNGHLSDYIPEATDGNKITVIQLLNHTSGLGEHHNLNNYKIVNEQGVHHYANVNYSLLGEIVEAVSGKSYEEYVTENIFQPLDMNATFAEPAKAEANGLMQGYENWFGFNRKTNCQYSNSDNAWITAPAGYISSSTGDLGKYLQMYLNGGENIISPESINEMFYNNVAVDDSIPYKYGMGWTLINEPLKQPALRHSGLVETGMSCIYILPESEIGIAMAINSNDYFAGTDFADRIGWGIVLMLMGDEPNQISSNEYVLKHFMYDAIYFVVLMISVLPFCLLGKYKKCISKGNFKVKIGLLLILHFLLPTFLLMLSRICFNTPLWVVRAFVPDMFFTIITSSVLLFICGIIKTYLLICNIRDKQSGFSFIGEMYMNKAQIASMSVLTLIIAFMDISGLPATLFINIQLADVTPIIFSLIANFLIIGVVAIIAMKLWGKNWALNLHKSGLSDGLKKYALAGILAGVLSCAAFCAGLPFDYRPTVWKVFVEGILYYFGVAFVEEFYVRGLFLNIVDKMAHKNRNHTAIAISVSSVIFGLGHIPGMIGMGILIILFKVISTIGMGLYFGMIYKKTDNLWLPIIMHTLIDICALPYCFTTFSGYKTISIIGLLVIYTALGLYSILLMRKEHLLQNLQEKN